MPERYCYSWVEDAPTKDIAIKIFEYLRADGAVPSLSFKEGFPQITGGFGEIKRKALNYLSMARNNQNILVFVITDLDKENCAPALKQKWLAGHTAPENLIFRVAVREAESWLFADKTEFAKFLSIPESNFPDNPDEIGDPKSELLNIIRKKGRKTWHSAMLPGVRTHIGPEYNDRLCAFIRGHWSPAKARDKSPSLDRALSAIEILLKKRGP
jgi:hypothetical protein